jgi:hypothetical protein
MRQTIRMAGLPVPWFHPASATPGAAFVARLPYPVVIKPLALSGSRGVVRVNDEAEFESAMRQLAGVLHAPDVRGERDGAHDQALIESFIPGREFALEGVFTRGALQVLAIFDKPDPLDGPYFEETIYSTPSGAPIELQERMAVSIASAARAMGLWHGPIHAECRVNDHGVFVLEIAARPIGGLCSRALRFSAPDGDLVSLEEVLLRHARGEDIAAYTREPDASGVMMIPIPRRGVLRRVECVEVARGVPGIVDVHITAKLDAPILPLPEGRSYLGFIFARGATPPDVQHALRVAHLCLHVVIDRDVFVVAAGE